MTSACRAAIVPSFLKPCFNHTVPGWRERPPRKVSLRVNSMRTGRLVSLASNAHRNSVWKRSCFAPKPPPM